MLNLRTTRSVIYTPPPTISERAALTEIADLDAKVERTADEERRRQELIAGAVVDQWRFTFCAMTVAQYGRYDANRRQVKAWLKETYPDADSEDRQDAGFAAWRWAYTMAALVSLATRQANRAADDAGAATWTPLDVPDTWLTPAGYMEEVPADLAEALAIAVFELNPGIFNIAQTADAKKNGGTYYM